MFTSILIPTDFSDCSRRALDVGLKLADLFGSDVVLLHAADDVNRGSFTAKNIGSVDDTIHAEESRLKAAAVDRLTKLKERDDVDVDPDRISVRVVSGAPAARILDVATEVHADLIVMGTHGRASLADKLLGSTAERVSRSAPCSVFTVKPDGFPFLRA